MQLRVTNKQWKTRILLPFVSIFLAHDMTGYDLPIVSTLYTSYPSMMLSNSEYNLFNSSTIYNYFTTAVLHCRQMRSDKVEVPKYPESTYIAEKTIWIYFFKSLYKPTSMDIFSRYQSVILYPI